MDKFVNGSQMSLVALFMKIFVRKLKSCFCLLFCFVFVLVILYNIKTSTYHMISLDIIFNVPFYVMTSWTFLWKLSLAINLHKPPWQFFVVVGNSKLSKIKSYIPRDILPISIAQRSFLSTICYRFTYVLFKHITVSSDVIHSILFHWSFLSYKTFVNGFNDNNWYTKPGASMWW